MSRFNNQYLSSEIYKHNELPLLLGNEFSFYRCLAFNEGLYEKTISELHRGNLRKPSQESRYGTLFHFEKVSYWADSPTTARAEVKHWQKTNDLLTFWAYDDATSTFPTTDNKEPLIIVDGREIGFADILEKLDNNENLSQDDEVLIKRIEMMNPDCLAYESKRHVGGVNFMFFEKGFVKLSLREVKLRLGNKRSKNSMTIICAATSDYAPIIESYGFYFTPIAKKGYDNNYRNGTEFLTRKKVYEQNVKRFLGERSEAK